MNTCKQQVTAMANEADCLKRGVKEMTLTSSFECIQVR